MQWLLAILKLASGILSFFSDKQKEDAGAAKQALKDEGGILDDVEAAKEARDALAGAPDDGMRDPYSRD